MSSSTNPLMDVSEALLSLLYPFQYAYVLASLRDFRAAVNVCCLASGGTTSTFH